MRKTTCTVCGESAYARGYCRKHYIAWRKYGDPLVVKQIQYHGLSLEERLNARLNKDGPIPAHVPHLGNCWIWTGKSSHKFGFGEMWNGSRLEGAHRIAWALANGPIPTGLLVRHRCDNPSCCRASHLTVGTQADNMRDVAIRGRGTMHMAKLGPDQVLEIDRLGREGADPAVLAKQFAVNRLTIVRILQGLTWGYLTGRTAEDHPTQIRSTQGMPLAERLWHYVDRTGGPSACWPWTGKSRNPARQGTLWHTVRRKNIAARRIAWEVTFGEIIDELWVVATCEGIDCCNPAHLTLKTPHEATVPRNLSPRKGEQHGMSKLTADDVRSIRLQRKNGMIIREIAASFGVSRQTIANILDGRTWKHVED